MVERKLPSTVFKKGCIPWNKGMKGMKPWYNILGLKPHKKGEFKHSNESKEKNKMAHLGKTAWNKGLKGYMSGEKHYRWKGGIGTERHNLMMKIEYKLWRQAVFARDNWTCQKCGVRDGRYLEADHIKPWSLYPELRYAIDNGRTLCKSCHRQTETWGVNMQRQLERVNG